jgi:hypothetical protein
LRPACCVQRSCAMRAARFSSVAIPIAFVVGACASEVGDVDRTQPNLLPKTWFEGEWHTLQTVTRVPFHQTFMFEGYQGGLERLRWHIDENVLIGYRSYEYLPGSEPPAGTQVRGAPIVAYRIVSHVDVQRDYNPLTGEENNVIVENVVDRPWHERAYLRVDWSRNLAPEIDPEFAFFYPIVQIEHVSPLSYYVQDISKNEADPDRAEFAAGYMAFSNRYVVQPNVLDCYYMFGEDISCNATEVTVRHSFVRIPDTVAQGRSDYQPREYRDFERVLDDNGRPMYVKYDSLRSRVAACTAEEASNTAVRSNAREVSCSEATIPVFDRFGFFRTERATWDRERGMTWEGRRHRINRFNIWKRSTRDDGTVLPMAEREVKPIVFYANAYFPERLWDAATATVGGWNEVFKDMVTELGNSHQGDVVVLRRNSCSVAGVQEFVAKHPDLGAVLDRTIGGLSRLDSRNLTSACASLEFNTRAALDPSDRFTWEKQGDLRYSFFHWVDQPQGAGPLGYGPSAADPETGETISAVANIYGAALETYTTTAVDIVDVINEKIAIDDLITGQNVREQIVRSRDRPMASRSTGIGDDVLATLNSRMSGLGDRAEQLLTPASPGFAARRLEKIRGSALEEALITDELLMAFNPGWRPGMPVDRAMIDRASPATWADPNYWWKRNQRINRFAMNNVDLAEFADSQVIGLALEHIDDTREDLRAFLEAEIFRAVQLHEMGHNFGLRHNFNGSMDPLNYQDEYWQIWSETKDMEEPQRTEERTRRKLGEYQYSTVMDYGARFNSDVHGLGHYDRNAIFFGYGDLIEVWADPSKIQLKASPGSRGQDYFDLDSAIFLRGRDFIPDLAGGVENIGARRYEDFDTFKTRYRQSLQRSLGSTEPFIADDVPYQFCGDEFAGPPGGIISCARWDHGATIDEVVQDVIEQYRNYYFWTHWRRERWDLDVGAVMDRIYTRTFDRLSTAFKYFFFYRAIVGQALLDPSRAEGIEFGLDFARAAIAGLNLLGEVLQTPDHGRFCLGTADTEDADQCDEGMFCPERWFDSCLNQGLEVTAIPLGLGREPFFEFSNDYLYRVDTFGAIYEKLLALQALSSSESVFFAVDLGSNLGTYDINPYRMFRPEVLQLFHGLIGNKPRLFAGYMNGVDEGGGAIGKEYTPRHFVDPARTFPEGFNLTEVPENASYVTPEINFTIAVYAGLFGTALMSSPFDGTVNFSDYTRVALKGAGDDHTADVAPERLVEFTDPKTLRTYRAVDTVDGDSIAASMLREARKIHTEDWVPAKARFDAAQADYEEDPADPTIRSEYLEARDRYERFDRRLDRWIDRVAVMRELSEIYEPGQ